jgi:hypothetical protein
MGKKGNGGDGPKVQVDPDEAKLKAELEAKVQADTNADPRVFEDPYKDELDDLKGQAADLGKGPLPTLDEETAGSFDTMLEAQKGELEMARKQQQEQLLLRMFGSGGQQSTVAGEAAGRMMFGQEQTHRQLLADDANRRLAARAEMADRMMSSIAFQAQVAQGQQQTALSAFGIEVQQAESAKDRAANMLDSLYGRRSNEAIAEVGAAAQIKSSKISASAQRYSADRSLEGSLAHAAASRYATSMQFELGKMGLDAEMEQFNADLGFRNKSLEYQDVWQNKGFELQEKELKYQDSWNKAAQSQANKQMWLSFAGGLLSDVTLKTEVMPITDAISKVKELQGYSWKWLGSPDAPDAGVLAQEVQKVMPTAVEETPEGFLVVNYTAMVGLMIAAMNELIERQEHGHS